MSSVMNMMNAQNCQTQWDTNLDVEEVEAEVEEVEGEQRGEEHHGHRHQHLGRPLHPRDLPPPAHT